MLYLRPGRPPLGGDDAVPMNSIVTTYPWYNFIVGGVLGFVSTKASVERMKVAPYTGMGLLIAGTMLGPIATGAISDAITDRSITSALDKTKAIWWDSESRKYVYSVAGLAAALAVFGPYVEKTLDDVRNTRSNKVRRNRRKVR